MFSYRSPGCLAKKIDWWLDHPEEKARRSRAYLAYSKEQFDQERCMDKMEQMLKETVEAHRFESFAKTV